MSPIIPSRYGHPKYNIFPQKSRAALLGGFKTSQRGTPGADSKSRRKQRIEESKITVQPAEDEDGDNFFSKHLAAARFQRNHRLINVLFSDIVVDQEQPSDADKLQACKKRVKSLTEYQKKLDEEIVDLNAKFNAKKAKIIDDGKKFAEKLSSHVASSKKELDVLKAAQDVRRQQESAHRQQAKIESASLASKMTLNNTSESGSVDPSSAARETKRQTPMDVCFGGDSSPVDEVRRVLDIVIKSVADTV